MTYIVRDDKFVYQQDKFLPVLAVETPAWYAWLEEVATFTFTSQYGTFTAHKERVSNGRGEYYWRAYRKRKGKLHRVYLGKSEHLTLAVLTVAASELAHRTADPHALPVSELEVARPHERAGASTPSPLLYSKLHIPPFPAHFVDRPHLMQRLSLGMQRRLVLLSASAGSGKTTLLSEWASQSPHPVVWLALDKEDNDVVRFWSYVVAGLQCAHFAALSYLLQLLHAPQLSPLQTVLIELLNVLEQQSCSVTIMLDDYHLIEMQAIHDSLSFFLEHLPPHIHVVIASRADPPLALARLRARGDLLELRSADLRFNLEEARTFFCQSRQISLVESELQALLEQTEGWAAGLQLAAVALQGPADAAHVIASFRGSSRSVQEYLLHEVLMRQPEPVQRFLLATSVLKRLTAPLCNALTGEESGEAMLASLAQKNLFLSPLDDDGRWYRYHHLLAEALRNRLKETQPDLFRDAHHRASDWHERHGMATEAIEHALAAQNFVHAANLVERHAGEALRGSEYSSVLQWLELFPVEILSERARLKLIQAQALIGSGRLEKGEQCLRELEQMQSANLDESVQTFFKGMFASQHARLAGVRGNTREALDHARKALTLLSGEHVSERGGILGTLGTGYFHLGDLEAAQQAFSDAIGCYEQTGDIAGKLFALRLLGLVQTQRALTDQANASYLQGIQLAIRHGLADSSVLGYLYVGRGDLLYEWNELVTADDHLTRGIELVKRGKNLIMAVDGSLTLAQVRQARGDMQGALAVLEQARQMALQTGDQVLPDFVNRFVVLLWLTEGDREAAQRCARTSGLYSYREVEDISTLALSFFSLIELQILAYLLVAQQNFVEAAKLLAQLQSAVQTKQRRRWHVKLLILHTLMAWGQQQKESALHFLVQALELSERPGYVRIFVDFGVPLIPIFKALLSSKMQARYSLHYVRQFLTLLESERSNHTQPAQETGVPYELLSAREITVLRCLAEGCSDQEIAQRLVLATSTVKTHIRRMYTKLNVHSRVQAVARGRELHLL